MYQSENRKYKYKYCENKKAYKDRLIAFTKNRPYIRNKIFKKKKGHS